MKKASVNKVRDALGKELKRSMRELKAPGHPRPYFISYLFRDVESYEVWGRYGALCSEKKDHKRNCYADVRVGNYRYDHVTKGGLSDNSTENESYELIEMPVEDSEDAIRFGLWRLTDAKYREAVSAYHGRKSRDVSYLDENKTMPSFEKHAAVVDLSHIKTHKVDYEHFQNLVKKASLVFKKYPEIKSSFCEFTAEVVTKIYVSSEGVERVWQQLVFSLSAYMWYHTKKVNQDYTLVTHTCDISELPDLKTFKRQIEEKVEALYQLESSHEMTSFAGPVLLAPKPAGLFIHEVVGHRLEGNRLLSENEGRTFKDRVGQKIMHEGLTIYDDPALRAFSGNTLVGHYPFDDEGVAPQKSLLVEKGVLKGFLTTRSPIKKTRHRSNGHARNHFHERPISRMGNLVIESHDGKDWAELKEQLIQLVKKKKAPYGFILLEVEGGETETEAYDFQAFLGDITTAVKVYPTGREVLVRGVDFVGTPLSSLANIVAVGKDYHVDNGYCGAESGTIPVSTISPALLLSNLELQLKNPAKVTQYALPLPWFDQKETSSRSKPKRPRKSST
ncbi:TldD/PmbA family protein [Pseudobacteriovorax antillogorgiicola]|uniref:Predicted Zn-dependent protease or its inactivated homolog n=1 Tax=Pseudobacteriovorax antillogorgiicola TaxID=1513793 RepID=A0A1Y6BAH0_9BACT|nr:metallopeptidase TldD-related protein [Pseudobacteriovorax antillogorgiicola]TCS58542.1 putative Zn-dependent protease [Pseudobacteriovorax antillogorgiicola]SME97797.1 Predicted Zn-dependent protease or its inactivated homolog [Pseudobacteriovorax antillogorgiicola]